MTFGEKNSNMHLQQVRREKDLKYAPATGQGKQAYIEMPTNERVWNAGAYLPIHVHRQVRAKKWGDVKPESCAVRQGGC